MRIYSHYFINKLEIDIFKWIKISKYCFERTATYLDETDTNDRYEDYNPFNNSGHTTMRQQWNVYKMINTHYKCTEETFVCKDDVVLSFYVFEDKAYTIIHIFKLKKIYSWNKSINNFVNVTLNSIHWLSKWL